MKRRIIEIDEAKCNGCGLCVDACHEGAIGILNGKAKLVRDDFCDGLGNCLPVCPTGAITFIEREASEFNSDAVEKSKKERADHCDCPSTGMYSITRETNDAPVEKCAMVSALQNWPVQIKLVPVNAHYFNGADLLIAADCAAYARAGFHSEFMHDKVTLIGCPKLDDIDYSKKLCEIISENDIKSLTVVRMEVPCCAGIEYAVDTALKNSGKAIPCRVVTFSVGGEVKEE